MRCIKCKKDMKRREVNFGSNTKNKMIIWECECGNGVEINMPRSF